MAIVVLHRSGYSSVFLGRPTEDAPLSCYKVYEKRPLQARHWLNISRECCILSRLQDARVHGVVQLISVADAPQQFSLQFKPCLGGNLYQSIARRECEDEGYLCAKVVIPLLRVLADLHALGIIHRDIKPENIFFEADGQLVLGDFGLAIDSNQDKPCSRVGTLDYMAPEVMAQPSADVVAMRNIPRSTLQSYSNAVDIWAVGILVHEALTGVTPFKHADPAVMALKVQFGGASKLPSHISHECQSFVDAVLQKQADKRLSARALLQHPWVQKHTTQAAPAPKSVRYSCCFDLHLGSDSVPDSCNNSGSCFAAPASCKITTAQLSVGSAPATAVMVKAAPKPNIYNVPAKAAATGCTVTYGFDCQQVQQLKPGTHTASPAARHTAFSPFDVDSHASNSSASALPVTGLLLVPALSAPMLLDSQFPAAPAGRTSQSGTGISTAGADTHRMGAGNNRNWRISAMASSAKVAAANTPVLRGRSWSPGKPAQCMLTAVTPSPAVVSTTRNTVMIATSAANNDAAAVAVAGAMEAPSVPAAGACAAAAGASAAAAAAAAVASPTLKQLLSPSRPPYDLARQLRSFPGGGRRHSAEVVLCATRAPTPVAAAIVPAIHSSTAAARRPTPMGHRSRNALNKEGIPPAVADELARSACEGFKGVQQPVLVPQSPSKACRMMKGVCTKMLHALRPTQPGQAF